MEREYRSANAVQQLQRYQIVESKEVLRESRQLLFVPQLVREHPDGVVQTANPNAPALSNKTYQQVLELGISAVPDECLVLR